MNQIDKDLNKLKTWLASENLEYTKLEKFFEQHNRDVSKVKYLLEHINWLKRIIGYVESARDDLKIHKILSKNVLENKNE